MNTEYEMSDIFDQPVCVRYGMSRNPLSVKPLIKSFGRKGGIYSAGQTIRQKHSQHGTPRSKSQNFQCKSFE